MEETYNIAKKGIAPFVKKGDIVILDGELGAGKTTFVRGFVEFFGINPEYVSSPTFTLINIYKGGEIDIFHVDFYRILEGNDVFFDELIELQDNGITVIEWGKKFVDELKEYCEGNIYVLQIKKSEEFTRELTFEKYTDN
ncbi:tRNA (adenosine(37)-N6)-threonylcarbamoyltransferase complex ATPase subunit type 1 TsaE [Thermotomaculum hydrothermale]|uniref:tRNA (adenosine(37)-N6)-threonylcarbamoyltransferase complex ATPase subunit type 1 TsaE n=1 Tax=Thermotomaculum hydrothermale TaxID=981385 RepID=UPI0019163CA9|nr:tRNA (adenosine(37)-N6)-threonylcarbamoyltransferase complex ATPase subunit type 1 TsaE [Thermotomaculum hydrothermale]